MSSASTGSFEIPEIVQHAIKIMRETTKPMATKDISREIIKRGLIKNVDDWTQESISRSLGQRLQRYGFTQPTPFIIDLWSPPGTYMGGGQTDNGKMEEEAVIIREWCRQQTAPYGTWAQKRWMAFNWGEPMHVKWLKWVQKWGVIKQEQESPIHLVSQRAKTTPIRAKQRKKTRGRFSQCVTGLPSSAR